jgi:hypothetical protein
MSERSNRDLPVAQRGYLAGHEIESAFSFRLGCCCLVSGLLSRRCGYRCLLFLD